MHRLGAIVVVKRITWQHGVVHFAARKLAGYEDLSIPMFVQGYLIIMKDEEEAIKDKMATHLEELICNAQLYGWEGVRAFHGVWFNQLHLGLHSVTDQNLASGCVIFC